MPDIALIAGAGWKPCDEWRLKGKWRDIVPLRTPELLWPLPGGETVLSRYVKQLKLMGVEHVFAGVGDPDSSPTESAEDRHMKRLGAAVPGYGEPAWTWDKIGYIESLDVVPLLIDDPMAPKKCCWSTIVDMLRQTVPDEWVRAIILMGDYVLNTGWLAAIAGQAKYPEQTWLLAKHSIEFITRESVPAYRQHLLSVIPQGQTAGWRRRHELDAHGFTQRIIWTPPSKDFPKERRAYEDNRRLSFSEVGPSEYPFGWKLAEGDPV